MPGDEDRPLRREVLSDDQLGPIARNIIKLWYVGIWYELPRGGADAFGARERLSPSPFRPPAYTEALLWPAIGANPPAPRRPATARGRARRRSPPGPNRRRPNQRGRAGP